MDDTSTSAGGMFFLFFTLLWLAMMAVTTSFGGGANTGEQSEGGATPRPAWVVCGASAACASEAFLLAFTWRD